jgi:hypothetical protein
VASDGTRSRNEKSPLTCTWVQVRGPFVVSLVHPARFELATSGFVNRRSIQLNYGCVVVGPLLILSRYFEISFGCLARLISGPSAEL